MAQMLVYVLTNRWYKADHLYKVGLHKGDDIKKLIAQYMGRYMPDVDIVKYWRVSDCYTTEAIMHRALNDTVHQYKNEWYQGNITKILDTLNKVVHRCSRDKYTLHVDDRVYPLSYVSEGKLMELGRKYSIYNPFPRDTQEWRRAQILLLYYRCSIITREEIPKIMYLVFGVWELPSRLYLYVNQDITSTEIKAIAKDLGITWYRGMSRMDLIDAIDREDSVFPDYDAMTMVQLRKMAKDRNLRGYSRLKKAELISFLEANT